MTATVLAVCPLTRAVQYDGTNSADIDAAISDLSIFSEGGGTLTVVSNGGQHSAPVGGYFIYNQSGIVVEGVSESYFGDFYQVIPYPADLDVLAEDIESLPDSVEAVGAATFAAIVATQSAVVPVTLMPAMPDANYAVSAQLFGGTNLGSLAITNIAVIDVDTVNVTVQNNGIVSLGASVLVAATAN